MSRLTMYWNRRPGVFVNKNTGKQLNLEGLTVGPVFTGSVREWYETLVETLIDMRNQLGKALGKKQKNVNVYVSPDVLCILECSVLFKPLNQKGAPPKAVGQLCGMNVVKDVTAPQFHITVEFEAKDAAIYGGVNIVED